MGPDSAPDWLREAVWSGGGEVVPMDLADALVWGDSADVEGLRAVLEGLPGIGWVQLPWAGIENFVPHLDSGRTWTCGKGVYAEPVAEMALALGVAGLRNLGGYARAGQWSDPVGRSLLDARGTILGGGGITESLVRLLWPWRCHITVVRRTTQAMDGVEQVIEAPRFADALPGADLVVLALPLTPDTDGLIGREELSLMEPHACLVNVARGRHVITGDLVEALERGVIGSAGLDVTEPEPLPASHPLWSLPNCIITPHTGNTPEMGVPLLSARIRENVRRFAEGGELIGLVDPNAGY